MSGPDQLALTRYADHSDNFDSRPDGPMTPLEEVIDTVEIGDVVWCNCDVNPPTITWEDVSDWDHSGTMPVEIVDFYPESEEKYGLNLFRVRTLDHWPHGFYEPQNQQVQCLALEREGSRSKSDSDDPIHSEEQERSVDAGEQKRLILDGGTVKDVTDRRLGEYSPSGPWFSLFSVSRSVGSRRDPASRRSGIARRLCCRASPTHFSRTTRSVQRRAASRPYQGWTERRVKTLLAPTDNWDGCAVDTGGEQ